MAHMTVRPRMRPPRPGRRVAAMAQAAVLVGALAPCAMAPGHAQGVSATAQTINMLKVPRAALPDLRGLLLHSASAASTFMPVAQSAAARRSRFEARPSPNLQDTDTPASTGVPTQEELNAPILLQANTLTLDADAGIWSAIGNVEASQGPRVLRADVVTYEEATGRVIASGNVSLTEPDGPAVYAERIEVTGDLRAGLVRSLRLVLNPTSRLAAARAVRKDGQVTVLEKAVYSPCKVCNEGDTPLWQLKAGRVTHDAARKTISYQNARLELFGVPVLYAPYFEHPDPTVTRRTGFLTPTAGNNTELGNTLEIPYFIELKPNMDITLSPLLTTREGPVAKAEFRHRTGIGQYNFSGSLANARFFSDEKIFFAENNTQTCTTAANEPGRTLSDGTCVALVNGGTCVTDDGDAGRLNASGQCVRREERTDRRLRGHIFGEGEFQLNDQQQLGYRLELTTDDTYLRRFEISQEDRLTNNAYYRNYRAQGQTSYNAYFFQGLREGDDDAQTPIVPALVEQRSVIRDPLLDGRFALDFNALSLWRTGEADDDLTTNGVDTQRLSLSGTWQKSHTSSYGDVVTAIAQLRGDFYYTSDVERVENGQVVEEEIAADRGLALAAVDWRWPFVRGTETSRQVIEPVVQMIYSPEGGNPDDIPNEDSASFEFDDTNLFSLNRFPGLDLWENGARANVGLRLATYSDDFNASLLVGQTFRARAQNEFAQGSGLEEKTSDYVGRFQISAGDLVNLTHRFRLDRESFAVRRNEVDLDLNTSYLTLSAGYLSIDDERSNLALEAREEVRLESEARITSNWLMRFGGRRDLRNSENINNFASLIYRDECTEFEASYRRRFTRDRDIEPSTSLLFRIRLKSVGS